VSAECRKV